MTMRKWKIRMMMDALGGLLLLGMAAGAQSSASEAAVTIDAGQSGAIISRDIFGQFAEQSATAASPRSVRLGAAHPMGYRPRK